MWFKQIQFYTIGEGVGLSVEKVQEKLAPFIFKPCLPSQANGFGWTAPLDEVDAPLVQSMNQCLMLCLQFEDKILPSVVIQQTLAEKVKEIEAAEARRVRQKEKVSLKEEITFTLLSKAFSKLSRLYGYIDTKNRWLVINTANAKKAEQFISFFKKAITEDVKPFAIKKPAAVMTDWLKNQSNPTAFAIEQACVLQDLEQQNRMIRCQNQDLMAASIQSLIKDGCGVKQMALCFQDQIQFVLADDFSIRGMQYHEDIKLQVKDLEAETKQQIFNADFFIMTQVLEALLQELLQYFLAETPSSNSIKKKELMTAE